MSEHIEVNGLPPADPFWDEWRGDFGGRPVMYIKRLLRIPLYRSKGRVRSIRIDLHKMVAPDAPDCFHTHPAWAIRMPLWGGYEEEILEERCDLLWDERWHRIQRALDISLVAPALCHRIASLLNGRVSYSLWIRGPITADVELRGDGWPAEVRGIHPERN